MLPATFNAADIAVGFTLLWFTKTLGEGACKNNFQRSLAEAFLGAGVYKHQPLRVTAVPVTIKRNFSVPETSRAGTAPLLEGSTGLQLLYMSPVRGKRKERAAVMSSTRELLKKHRYDNKPDIM